MILCFIGTTELLLIGGLALLLVGGKKLPEMMRGLGKGVKEFKDGMNEATQSQRTVEVDKSSEDMHEQKSADDTKDKE